MCAFTLQAESSRETVFVGTVAATAAVAVDFENWMCIAESYDCFPSR